LHHHGSSKITRVAGDNAASVRDHATVELIIEVRHHTIKPDSWLALAIGPQFPAPIHDIMTKLKADQTKCHVFLVRAGKELNLQSSASMTSSSNLSSCSPARLTLPDNFDKKMKARTSALSCRGPSTRAFA
jgi:ferritin-like protein